ncbi:MAG: four helix bundle protein [Vicinamibacteria bacterium]
MTTQTTARPERLDAYRLAVEFHRQLPEIPRGSGLGDQLARASASVALNLAEGLGRSSNRDRARFFEIAKASAMECQAALDLIPGVPDEARRLVRRLVQTTSGLWARQSQRSAR